MCLACDTAEMAATIETLPFPPRETSETQTSRNGMLDERQIEEEAANNDATTLTTVIARSLADLETKGVPENSKNLG